MTLNENQDCPGAQGNSLLWALFLQGPCLPVLTLTATWVCWARLAHFMEQPMEAEHRADGLALEPGGNPNSMPPQMAAGSPPAKLGVRKWG